MINHDTGIKERLSKMRTYGTCVGAWGDSIIDYGTFRQLVGEGGIICWTYDPAIPEFLRLQQGVEEVIWLEPKDRGEYTRICRYMADNDFPRGTLIEFAQRASVSSGKIIHTSMGVPHDPGRPASHWHGAILPPLALQWAGTVRKSLPSKFYLIHALSLNSTARDDHWHHWNGAIDYLLTETDHTYVFVGQDYHSKIIHPRLVDLVGKSPSLSAVFALADLSSGIITTSSGLSHYSVVQNIPACVAANGPLSNGGNYYFARWLASPNVRLVNFNDGLDVFKTKVHEVVGQQERI